MRDPEWLAKQLGLILRSGTLQDGVCTADTWKETWKDLDPPVREFLVSILDEFDLAYRTDTKDLVVASRLPHAPPTYSFSSERKVRLDYRFETELLPGIPAWFIARSHRAVTHRWRNGVVLRRDDGNGETQARLIANEVPRTVRIEAAGNDPVSLFASVRTTFEDTVLPRYPGLANRYERIVPCPCGGRDGAGCAGEFAFEDLRQWDESHIKCGKSLKKLLVAELLHGIRIPTDESTERILAVIREKDEELRTLIEEGHRKTEHVKALVDELRGLQVELLADLDRIQNQPDFQVPVLFTFRPTQWRFVRTSSIAEWLDQLSGQGEEMELQLFCQYPDRIHECGVPYCTRAPAEWMLAIQPLVKTLKPLLKAAVAVSRVDLGEMLSVNGLPEFNLRAEFTSGFGELSQEQVEASKIRRHPERHADAGRAMRFLWEFLEEQDDWPAPRSLRKARTIDGKILWVCPEHAGGHLIRNVL